MNFLPGGISLTLGPTNGEWMAIKSFEVGNTAPLHWSKEVDVTLGHNQSLSSTVTKNWNVSAEMKASVGIDVSS